VHFTVKIISPASKQQGAALVGFSQDIRPLFRQRDIDAMRQTRQFDLSSHEDVSARAEMIFGRLEAGDMPCDSAWPQSKVDLFRQWINQGMQP
jgi:hypothetical protein